MQILSWFDFMAKDFSFFQKAVALTVGCFDGPHIGHKMIFEKVINEAKSENLASLIITFSRPLASFKHPREYLGDISSLKIRLQEYEKYGFDFCVVVDFSSDFRKIKGDEFLYLLKEKTNFKFIAEGNDFHFGEKGASTILDIKDFAKKNNIKTYFQDFVLFDNLRVSSSTIRKTIKNADFQTAEKMLGKKWMLDFRDIEKCGNYFKRRDILQVLPKNGEYDIATSFSEMSKVIIDDEKVEVIVN